MNLSYQPDSQCFLLQISVETRNIAIEAFKEYCKNNHIDQNLFGEIRKLLINWMKKERNVNSGDGIKMYKILKHKGKKFVKQTRKRKKRKKRRTKKKYRI